MSVAHTEHINLLLPGALHEHPHNMPDQDLALHTVHRTGSDEGRHQLNAQGIVTRRLSGAISLMVCAHRRLVCILAAQRAVVQRAHSRLKVQPQLQRPARCILPEGLQAPCTALRHCSCSSCWQLTCLQQAPGTGTSAGPHMRHTLMSARGGPLCNSCSRDVGKHCRASSQC